MEHIPDEHYKIYKLRLGDTIQNHPDAMCLNNGTAIGTPEGNVVITKQSAISLVIRITYLSKEEIAALYERFCK